MCCNPISCLVISSTSLLTVSGAAVQQKAARAYQQREIEKKQMQYEGATNIAAET